MKGSLRRTVLGLVPTAIAALAFGVPTAASDLTLSNVGLNCSDGTNLGVALDPTALLALSDAVDGINLNPAGDPALSCGLTQSPDPGSNSGPMDYAVGGGQLIFSCVIFGGTGLADHENFSLSGHVPDDTLVVPGTAQPAAGGTFNTTIPKTPDCTIYGTIVAKIDCVQVTGNHADMTGVITKSTGNFLGPDFVGSEIWIAATDNDPMPDTVQADLTDAPCSFIVFEEFPVARGNISVHDA